MSNVNIESFAADLNTIILKHLHTIIDNVNKENQSTLAILNNIPFVKELRNKLETAEYKIKQLTNTLEHYKKDARINLEISEMSPVKRAPTAEEIRALMKIKVKRDKYMSLSDDDSDAVDSNAYMQTLGNLLDDNSLCGKEKGISAWLAYRGDLDESDDDNSGEESAASGIEESQGDVVEETIAKEHDNSQGGGAKEEPHDEVEREKAEVEAEDDEVEEEEDEEDQADDDEEVEADDEEVEEDQADDDEVEEEEDEEVEADDEEVEEGDEAVEAEDEEVEAGDDEVEAEDEEVEADDEEVEAEDEEVEAEDEEVETDDEEEDSDGEEIEVEEITIEGCRYYTSDQWNGSLFEYEESGIVGDEVGKLVNGKAFFS